MSESNEPHVTFTYLAYCVVERLEGGITEAGELIVHRRRGLCDVQDGIQDVNERPCTL